MGRAPRTTPIWISIGAAAVVLAAVIIANSTFRAAAARGARGGGAVEPMSAPLVPSGDEQPQAAPATPDVVEPPAPVPAPEDDPDAEPADEPSPASQIADVLPHGSAGMLIGIDPITGSKGMPSLEFRAAVQRAAALGRSQEGLQVVHKPDGSMMIDLQDRFQDYAVIRIAPDGSRELSCVQGPDVEGALAAPPAPPVPSPSTREER